MKHWSEKAWKRYWQAVKVPPPAASIELSLLLGEPGVLMGRLLQEQLRQAKHNSDDHVVCFSVRQ